MTALLRIVAAGTLLLFGSSAPADWPQASGPNGNFQVNGDAPAAFSATHGRNILWRSPLPNTGQATPIISGGRVFVTSHEVIDQNTELGKDILGLCFDAETGEELWRREIPGTRETDLSSLFSDNTAASPVAEGRRVCFANVGGALKCFSFEGEELWSYDWVPFGRHHARLHEPILHDGNVITVQYPRRDLLPIHTTKPGAKPLGRGREYWTHLQAFNLRSGKREWIAETGTSIHQTSLLGKTTDGKFVILTGRGGGHQPPEEPYGLSLVDAGDGTTIWDLPIRNYPSAQNACWDGKHAYAITAKEHLWVDLQIGKVVRRVSLLDDVTVTRRNGDAWSREDHVTLGVKKWAITKNSNALAGRYHYFRSGTGYMIGRVHLDSGNVEYLQVPAQVVRRPDRPDEVLWDATLPNDMRNIDGFVATQDRRNAGDGWGHVSAASPVVIGNKIYLPTMIGMVYVLDWNAERLDENALLSCSDLGPATETWSLSSLAYSKGHIYARTLKELICIGASTETSR